MRRTTDPVHLRKSKDRERIVRPALAKFLVAKRAAVPPALVGLQKRAPRSALGVWPDEIALLSHRSLSVYTRFEMGRDINLPRTTVMRIASALRLSQPETDELLDLAGLSKIDPTSCDPSRLGLLDSIYDCPAYVCNARLDVTAFNQIARNVFDFEGDGTRHAKNQVWRMFAEARRRKLCIEHKRESTALVKLLRRNFTVLSGASRGRSVCLNPAG